LHNTQHLLYTRWIPTCSTCSNLDQKTVQR